MRVLLACILLQPQACTGPPDDVKELCQADRAISAAAEQDKGILGALELSNPVWPLPDLQLISCELHQVEGKAINVQGAKGDMTGKELKHHHAACLAWSVSCFNLLDWQRVLNKVLQS